jgi:hypothetical protein
MASTTQTDQTHLMSWLEGRDVKCPVCEYNLRDLKGPVCPECSAPLVLSISSSNHNPGPWITAMLSVALGAGFDGVVTVILTVALISDPPKAPAEWMHVALLYGTFLGLTLLSASALILMYRTRRRWAYWSRTRRRWTAALVFLGASLGHAAVGAGILLIMRRW